MKKKIWYSALVLAVDKLAYSLHRVDHPDEEFAKHT